MKARHALVALSLAWVGCTQTDVVARELASSVSDDAGGSFACMPAECAAFSSVAARCEPSAASGPLFQVGDSCNGEQQAFAQALCSCTDVVTEHRLTVEHADAEEGTASVAINRTLTSGSEVQVQGVLRVAGDFEVPDGQVSAASIQRGESPACACEAETLPDVGRWIESADPSLNRAGFDLELLENVVSDETALLPCGNLVVDRIAGPSDLRLRAQGKAAIFVRGDVALDGGMQVVLDPGAELDLIVSGNVRVVSALELGDEASAGRVRVYVGGEGTIDLGAEAFVAGLLYAPRAELVTRGPLELRGPIFVRRAAPGESVHIRLPERAAQSAECAP